MHKASTTIKKCYSLMNGLQVAFKASFDCDKCHKILKNPECKACHRMVNYFKVFEMYLQSPLSPQDYKVDSTTISEKAKQLQKEFHPDKHAKEGNQQKYVEYSAYINDAKTTLLDDLKRALYLVIWLLLSIDGAQRNQC